MIDLQAILKELRSELEALYGRRLKGLYLFGSYARGDQDEGSDIDVGVVLAGLTSVFEEIRRTSEIVGELSLGNNCLVSLAFIAEDDWRDTWTPFLANLRREAVAI